MVTTGIHYAAVIFCELLNHIQWPFFFALNVGIPKKHFIVSQRHAAVVFVNGHILEGLWWRKAGKYHKSHVIELYVGVTGNILPG